MRNDFVLLIMVSQNHQAFAPVLTDRFDAGRKSRIAELFIRGQHKSGGRFACNRHGRNIFRFQALRSMIGSLYAEAFTLG